MITNFQYQKTVDKLRERMGKIRQTYKAAYLYSFAGGIALFACNAAYTLIRAVFMSGVSIRESLGIAQYSQEWHVLIPNAILLISSLLCAVLGSLSFKRRMKIVKFVLFLLTVAFMATCAVLLCMGFDKTSFIIALIFAAGLVAFTVACFIKDSEEATLSKIDGYPDFDPLLMRDIEPDPQAREKLRFRDKGEEGYKELQSDRDAEFIKNNPNSEMAAIIRREQEEQREKDIEDWLDEISGN